MAIKERYQSASKQGALAFCSLLLVLSGCTSHDEGISSDGTSSLALPQLVQRMTVPADGTLSATVTIDKDSANAQTSDMEVNVSSNQLNFEGNLDSGSHSFLIELFYQSPSVNKIRLVSASRTLIIENDQTVGFNDGDYIYDDLDDDGFTNVLEIENNSNPNLATSQPDSSVADDNYEPNNTFNTAYDLSNHRGVFFNNSVKTNTRAGRLSHGDNLDIFKITTTSAISIMEIDVAIDDGIVVDAVYLVGNEQIRPPVEITSEIEEDGYTRLKATITTAQPRDYYLYFYGDSDSTVEGSYAFSWK